MNKNSDRKLYIYSSLFIALTLNVPKLFALRKTGIVAQYWHFNLAELSMQTVLNFLFCFCIFFYSGNRNNELGKNTLLKSKPVYIAGLLIITVVFSAVGILLQKAFFPAGILYGGGIALRLLFSLLLVFIELKIVSILKESRDKEIENEHLRNAYLKSELEVLKGQLNPHFFFNSLSSLSAVVREDPSLAQYYINHLSKVYRYSLQTHDGNLSTLKEETDAAKSYAELMKMRYETGFEIDFLTDRNSNNLQLPHMSLQPLIENALKHNSADATKPLHITISLEDNFLVVKNNLQRVSFPLPGAGIGLVNMNERYKILMQQQIEIMQTVDTFMVKLPVK